MEEPDDLFHVIYETFSEKIKRDPVLRSKYYKRPQFDELEEKFLQPLTRRQVADFKALQILANNTHNHFDHELIRYTWDFLKVFVAVHEDNFK